ncbi:MAG: C10 family peptidase [Alistipes sp.]|nr:C10 family peptidase [Alistipes sp.]
MKKILLLLAFISISALVYGSPIGEQRAREIAKSFFMQNATRSSSTDVALAWAGDDIEAGVAATDVDLAMLYIYEPTDAKGFVVIAGDDTVAPIVAYSFENSIDVNNMAEATRAILAAWGKQVSASRRVAKPVTRADDAAIGSVVKKYVTAQWGQNAPFNGEAPVYSGSQSVTGCVATAMAIIARYHRYPEKGVGTIPSYSYTLNGSTKTIAANTLGRTYDYDNMPLSYNEGYTSAQGSAVAALMYDMGTAVQMQYSPAESGSFHTAIPQALSKYFGYSKATMSVSRGDYTDKEWNAVLKENLDKYGPTIFRGSSDAGGHAFIIDGYTSKYYFSVNFGWDGLGNGYFKLPDIEFYKEQAAICYLEPDPAGTTVYRGDLQLIALGSYDAYGNFVPIYKGIISSATEYSNGTTFTCKIGGIRNTGYENFTGKVALVLCDKSGSVKQELYTKTVTIKPNYNEYATPSVTINTDVANGDRLRIYYMADGATEWSWARTSDDTCVSEIVIKSSAADIAEKLNLKYSNVTKTLTLGAPIALNYTITSGIMQVASGSIEAHSSVGVDMSEYNAGSYTLSLTSGGESYNLVIRL